MPLLEYKRGSGAATFGVVVIGPRQRFMLAMLCNNLDPGSMGAVSHQKPGGGYGEVYDRRIVGRFEKNKVIRRPELSTAHFSSPPIILRRIKKK